MTLFNCNYPLKALAPNTVTLEVRPSIYEFWEDTIQSTVGRKGRRMVKGKQRTYSPTLPPVTPASSEDCLL